MKSNKKLTAHHLDRLPDGLQEATMYVTLAQLTHRSLRRLKGHIETTDQEMLFDGSICFALNG